MKINKIFFVSLFIILGVSFSYGQNTSEKKDVEIKNKNIEKGTYTSKTNIQASGTIKKGTKGVVFKAEEGITLSSGFSSEAGSDVILKIEKVEDKEDDFQTKGVEQLRHSIDISPNPFKYSTTVFFTLPKNEMTSISIYDEKDKLVKQLVQSAKEKGNHELEIKSSNLKSGVYKVVLKTTDVILVKKMFIIQ